MKKLLAVFVLLMTLQAFADEKVRVTVKSTEKNSGVVIVNVNDGKKIVELNCNDGFPQCAVPKPGEYWMVMLPKNHGVYECQNVDLYPGDVDPESSNSTGEYCLIAK